MEYGIIRHMKFIKTISKHFNIVRQCRELDVGLWSCPQFLFLILGTTIIGTILVTYSIGQRYTEAEIVALIVVLLTGFLFIVSYVIVGAFEKVVEARRRESKQAKELLELKDQFVFVAAHELKTPATAIQKGMELLEEKGQDFFEKEKDLVKIVKSSNERLLSLVQDLLEVARIQGKTIHVDLSPVSVQKTYEDAIKELEAKARDRNIEVQANFADELPAVLADERRLKEIFINFLSNAIKYSDQENGKVWIEAKQTGGGVEISVNNNGAQISKEDQKHVFQKFWRSESAQKSTIEGTGLGLFIVQQLAEMMEGKVRFTSEPDKTSFFVELKHV